MLSLNNNRINIAAWVYLDLKYRQIKYQIVFNLRRMHHQNHRMQDSDAAGGRGLSEVNAHKARAPGSLIESPSSWRKGRTIQPARAASTAARGWHDSYGSRGMFIYSLFFIF